MSSEKGEKSPNSAAREWAEIARREFDEAFPDQPMSQAELRGLLHVSLLGELRLIERRLEGVLDRVRYYGESVTKEQVEELLKDLKRLQRDFVP